MPQRNPRRTHVVRAGLVATSIVLVLAGRPETVQPGERGAYLMRQVGDELLADRLEVTQPGHVSRQENQGPALNGPRAHLQNATRTGRLDLGRMLKPRLARSECQGVDSMVSNDFNQWTANRMLDGGEHQPRRRVEPPDLDPDQQQDALFNVVDDLGERRALASIDRRLGSGLYRRLATLRYRSPSPEPGHLGRM